MKKTFSILILVGMLLSACQAIIPAEPTVTITNSIPTETVTPLPPTETPLPTLTPTPDYPPEGIGPVNYPLTVNPLTGMEVTNPALLDRRPLAIKVENLPRSHRPQYGLSLSDLVFEYYTEQGSTRFIAVYYGEDATQVGPIRSARHFDVNVVQMYDAVFIFGSAYEGVYNRLLSSDFYNRLVVEGIYSAPALFRYEPNDANILMANTTLMPAALQQLGIDNTRQDQSGMFFQMQVPAGGQTAQTVFVRFSSAIYNRWTYDPVTQSYQRASDTENDLTGGSNEQYAMLLDQSNGQQISAENVVIIFAPYSCLICNGDEQVYDAPVYGSGAGYIARNGQIFPVLWNRAAINAPLTLMSTDGQPFPYHPGNTWFEVIDQSSQVIQQDSSTWRFIFNLP